MKAQGKRERDWKIKYHVASQGFYLFTGLVLRCGLTETAAPFLSFIPNFIIPKCGEDAK